MIEDEEEQRRHVLAADAEENAALARRVEAEMHQPERGLSTNRLGSEPFDFDTLKRAMATLEAMPPMPFFGSSVLFPADRAVVFEHERRKYVLAHPIFWKRIPASTNKVEFPSPLHIPLPIYGGVEIVNLDGPENRDERLAVVEAMGKAMGGE